VQRQRKRKAPGEGGQPLHLQESEGNLQSLMFSATLKKTAKMGGAPMLQLQE